MSQAKVVSSLEIVRQLWTQASLPVSVLENTIRAGNVELVGDGKQEVRSSFQLTAVAQGCAAAISLVDHFRRALSNGISERGLVLPKVRVDARHAIAEYKGFIRIHTGESKDIHPVDSKVKELLGIPSNAVEDWDDLAGMYETKENQRWVRLHTNFPHHKLGILQLLGLVDESLHPNTDGIQEVVGRITKEQVAQRVREWEGFELEAAAQVKGLCVTAYRKREEWLESEMGRAVRDWMDENVGGSAFRITAIPNTSASSQVRRGKEGEGGMKVIDMSRVIAGPYSTRTLAAHGANVLLLSHPDLPHLPLRELDTLRGKRTAFLALPPSPSLPDELIALVRTADVFSQAYRPRGLASRGLSSEQVNALRPGIVYTELTAFGFTGPWSHTRGYDSLTQTACGMNHLEGLHYQTHSGIRESVLTPKPLPLQALDYVAGSLMCFATLAAKCRAAQNGWKVQVSLASTAEWIIGLGQLHDGIQAWKSPPTEVIPQDLGDLERICERYRVRGLDPGVELSVLAIRHAGVPPRQEANEDEDESGIRWTVPAHLGVDTLTW